MSIIVPLYSLGLMYILNKYIYANERVKKLLCVIYVVVNIAILFLPNYWGERFTSEELHGNSNPYYSLWELFNASLIISIPIALIYKKKAFIRFTILFGFLAFFLDYVFFFDYIDYVDHAINFPFGEETKEFFLSPYLVHSLFLIASRFKIYFVLRLIFDNKKFYHFSDSKDILNTVLLIIPLLFVNMPLAFPAQFLGTTTNIKLSTGSVSWFLWITFLTCEIIVLTLIFKNKSEEDKRILLLVISISLVYRYLQFYRTVTPIMANRFPIQLCDFASIIIPLAVIFKNRKLSLLIAFLNIIAAILAVLLCDCITSEGILYFMNQRFLAEHNGIILAGTLMLTTGFLRIDKKDFKPAIIISNIYLLCAFCLGTIFDSIYRATGNEYFYVNYLFMFDIDAFKRVLPLLVNLAQMKVSISYVSFNLAQLLIYFVLFTCGLGTFSLVFVLQKNKDLCRI